jgi:hypothetical protein
LHILGFIGLFLQINRIRSSFSFSATPSDSAAGGYLFTLYPYKTGFRRRLYPAISKIRLPRDTKNDPYQKTPFPQPFRKKNNLLKITCI